MSREFIWSYGITTVPARRETLLPRTVASLRAAGFETPRLFVDHCSLADGDNYRQQYGLPVTVHDPGLRAYGNWLSALLELYLYQPNAARYALFQDDIVAVKGLREYLERVPVPDRGYQNCILYPQNALRCPTDERSGKKVGWFLSDQLGKGAQALIFTQKALVMMLTYQESSSVPQMVDYLMARPQNVHRGHQAIDGGVVSAMKRSGWREYVHYPSLVYHTGRESTMEGHGIQPETADFPSESFDAMSLLK